MADKATFTVRLIDRVKGPARAVNSSIGKIIGANRRLARSTGGRLRDANGRFVRSMHAAEKATGRFTDANGRLREANGRFVKGMEGSITGLGKIGKLSVLKGNLLTRAAFKFIHLAGAVSSASFEMLTFGQNARLGFRNLAHHGDDPGKLFEHATELAKRFGLDVFDTSKQYRKFLALGFTPKGIDDLVRMSADMRVLGTSTEEVGSIMRAIGKIRSQGRAQGDELMILAEAGIRMDFFNEEVAKTLGIAAKDVQKYLSGGKVDAATAIDAIQKTVNRKLKQRGLGDSGKRFADETISGMIGRFRAYFQAGGVQAFEKAAKPITRVLGKTLDDFMSFMDSPRGARFIDDLAGSLERMASAAAEFGGEIASSLINADWKEIGKEIRSITDGIIEAAKVVGSIGKGIKDIAGIGSDEKTSSQTNVVGTAAAGAGLGAWIGSVVPGLGTLVGAGAGAAIGGGFAWLENQGFEMASSMVDGMSSPRVGSGARAAGYALGRQASAGSKEALGIHSPSKVAMEDGRMWTRGLAIGMQREGWRVSSAHEGFADQALSSFSVGPQMASMAAPKVDGVGRGTSRINVNLHTEVHGAGGDSEEVGRVAARETRREIESFFRQLSLEA